MIWISNVLRFQRVGSQLRCDSNDFGGELMLDSSDLEFECTETSFKNESLKTKNEAFLRDFLQN